MKKTLKLSLGVAATALLLSTPAMAFHDGGVAKCEGCHTMHNSQDNSPVVSGSTQFEAPAYLLKGSTQSDACLNCHESGSDTLAKDNGYHISSTTGSFINGVPVERTPGGDFAWLKMTTAEGAALGNGGLHGHNILATDHGYVADGRAWTTSPGGSYPADSFYCSSCHDPHGKYRRMDDGTTDTPTFAKTGAPIVESGSYGATADSVAGTAVGSYRLLAGAGYQPASASVAFGATTNPPVAVAPSKYNHNEESNTDLNALTGEIHVAYGEGMSEWCANCHGALLENAYSSGDTAHTHPAGNSAKLTTAISDNYNAYVSSGITGTGVYDSLVPYEIGTAITADLVTASTETTAAAGGGNVSCLSCHRAHASGFPSMLRYDIGDAFMTEDESGTTVYSAFSDVNDYKVAAYNGRPATAWAPFQRVLCNKCHAKD